MLLSVCHFLQRMAGQCQGLAGKRLDTVDASHAVDAIDAGHASDAIDTIDPGTPQGRRSRWSRGRRGSCRRRGRGRRQWSREWWRG